MAWKRGTQNNTPGEIRKGHIREFLFPSSKGSSVSEKLRIIDTVDLELFNHSTAALVSNRIPDSFLPFLIDGTFFIHSHDHPRCVLRVIQHDSIPAGCIALTETQRINSKVCVGELQEWTIYQGDSFAYDAREGALGDTAIRQSTQPPPVLQSIGITVRPRHTENTPHTAETPQTVIDARNIIKQYSALLYGCIVSCEDIYTTHYTTQYQSFDIVGRISELLPAIVVDDDENETEEDFQVVETYRGFVSLETEFFISLENPLINWELQNSPKIPPVPPHKDLINIFTKDDEHFPVLRRLLRPCIALTSIVQCGRGIYSTPNSISNTQKESTSTSNLDSNSSNNEKKNNIDSNIETNLENENEKKSDVSVDVDACTFDKVLLYLEHEARGDVFKFDPLLAAELREAAVVLGVAGLQDVCDKVLGSFKERVRRSPIRYSEVVARNKAGTLSARTPGGKRTETLLLLDGMVMDISRWIEEHPGGSSIIPEQALDVDSTVFFEIYHASKQSFLYLKEFYIGELAAEDMPLVPSCNAEGVQGSAAFLEQLKKLTKWRLTPDDMILYKNQKSF